MSAMLFLYTIFLLLKSPMQVLAIILIVPLAALNTSFRLLSDVISIEYYLSSQIAITSDGGNL